MRRAPGLTANDPLLAVTTLSFDIAGLEVWLPLSVGARVVFASRSDVLDGERLIALVAEHRIRVMQATPATFRLMLDAGWTGARDLKLLCGGEALPRDLAATLASRVFALWNMYGPTETTIWSTAGRVDDAAEAHDRTADPQHACLRPRAVGTRRADRRPRGAVHRRRRGGARLPAPRGADGGEIRHDHPPRRT